MYTLHFCKVIDSINGIYDERIEKSKLPYFIDCYSLINHGKTREYWINNVEIIKNKDKETFNYVNDLDITIEGDKVIREYTIKECIPFLFSEVDCQEEYNLYIGLTNNVKVIVKESLEYLTIEFISDNIESFKNINLIK